MNKMWSIQTMEYYSTLKEKEVLSPDTTWRNVEDIVLGKISRGLRVMFKSDHSS